MFFGMITFANLLHWSSMLNMTLGKVHPLRPLHLEASTKHRFPVCRRLIVGC